MYGIEKLDKRFQAAVVNVAVGMVYWIIAIHIFHKSFYYGGANTFLLINYAFGFSLINFLLNTIIEAMVDIDYGDESAEYSYIICCMLGIFQMILSIVSCYLIGYFIFPRFQFFLIFHGSLIFAMFIIAFIISRIVRKKS